MLPPAISIAPRTRPSSRSRGPVRKKTAASRRAVQAATKMGHGRRSSGYTSWANAGEYGYAPIVFQFVRPA